jgi:hypothetical protein
VRVRTVILPVNITHGPRTTTTRTRRAGAEDESRMNPSAMCLQAYQEIGVPRSHRLDGNAVTTVTLAGMAPIGAKTSTLSAKWATPRAMRGASRPNAGTPPSPIIARCGDCLSSGWTLRRCCRHQLWVRPAFQSHGGTRARHDDCSWSGCRRVRSGEKIYGLDNDRVPGDPAFYNNRR